MGSHASGEDAREDLRYWRLSLSKWSLRLLIVSFPLSFAMAAPSYIEEGRQGLLAYGVVFYLLTVSLLALRRRFHVQALGVAGLTYTMAILQLISHGPTHIWPLWLLCASMCMALFYGLRGVVAAAVISSAALIGIYGLVDASNPAWAAELARPRSARMRFVFNFLALQTIVTSGVGYILDRLGRSLTREQDQREQLSRSHAALADEQERRHLLERKLEHSRRLDALGTLAASLAHDLNNLIGPMRNLVELVREELGPRSSARRELGEALQLGERATELCREMLAFGREIGPSDERVDLAALADEVVKQRQTSTPPDVRVSSKIPVDIDARVQGNEAALHRVLTNLLGNAIDACEARGGAVELRLSASVERVRVELEDQGAGMTPEVVAQIFDPFFTTKGRQGTGLGLATVHGIVHALGGRIEVDSEHGVGTTFCVELPRSQQVRPSGA